MEKKVLIITYYWPPGGGAGVQRWLKFAKYLGSYGWTPVIYTPSNGEMPVVDESLEKDIPPGIEVIKRPIWEPYSVYKKFVGSPKGERINTGFLTEKKKPGLAQRISVWIRGNFFIPDARCFWIRPSVAFLKEYLSKHPVQAIISTGPPHSMHLIAHALHKNMNIPWIADFRDPWTNIDYYKDLMLTTSSDRKHHQLEKMVVTSADKVVVIGNTMRAEFEEMFGRKIDVITNGYDEDDIPASSPVDTRKFTLAHVGTMVKTRNPLALWQALAELVNRDAEFASALQIRLTGKVDVACRESLETNGLSSYASYIEYLPHDQVAGEQRNASVLLLLLNDTPNAKGILTGKMFEYMASGKPVLCIGPIDGDAATLLKETGSGYCFNFTDKDGVRDFVMEMYRKWKSGSLPATATERVTNYSRRKLTGQLAGLLDEIIK